jgi:copper chaperone
MKMKKIFTVEGMSCEHCVAAVTKTLTELNGVSGVLVDLSRKTAEVEFDPEKITEHKIKDEIEDIGYDVSEIRQNEKDL